MSATLDEFWHDAGRYGAVHRARNPSATLLIFVHGLFGGATRTWRHTPCWVLEKAGMELDVISYSYPSLPWQRCTIAQAATDLKTWLATEFSEYRHLLFITHSTGGLVVKRCLEQAFLELQRGLAKDPMAFVDSPSVWTRTRHVINISVPHRGGAPLLTTLSSAAYYLIYALTAPALYTIRSLTQGSCDWGRNIIIPALRHNHPLLIALENQFLGCRRQSEALGLPTPLLHDVCAKSDLALPVSADPSKQEVYIRGTHNSVKIPRRPSGPMVSLLAGFVKRYRHQQALTITDHTLSRIYAINQTAHISKLVEIAANETAARAGTQSQVFRALVQTINTISDRPRRLAVTGIAGVGKSTVMRTVAWQLGRAFLDDPETNPLPLFVPLHQISSLPGASANDAYTWEGMWQWWLRWVHSLVPEEHCTLSWLEEKMRCDPVAVLLDGVDDFLLNHSALGLSAIIQIVRDAIRRYAMNARLCIIASIRDTQHGYQRLADDDNHLFQIQRLSPEQAVTVFPRCKDWLPRIKNAALRNEILTPLILTSYEPSPEQQDLFDGDNTAALRQSIIDTFLRRSQLIGMRTSSGQVIELEYLRASLALIAWLFFYRSRGEIEFLQLQREAAEVHQRWEQHFHTNSLARDHEILVGFRLLEDAPTCRAILNHTVFSASGPSVSRFIHRSWQEFLLARFFLYCMHIGYFADFAGAKFYSAIFRIAGEMSPGDAVSAARVSTMLDTWRAAASDYVASNFFGFISWTTTPIDAQALQLLLDQMDALQPLPRLILIGGLGYRVLANVTGDHSLADIRRFLVPKLEQYADPAQPHANDPVAASIAWCYQKIFAAMAYMPPPPLPWPELSFERRHTDHVLPIVAARENHGFMLDERSRALQQALIPPILDTFDHPLFVIRAVHYLYCLVAAKCHGVHCLAVSQELPDILRPGDDFEQIVRGFTAVPEVFRLYQICQDNFAERPPASRSGTLA